MDEDETEELRSLLSRLADVRGAMQDGEQRFFDDQVKRFDQYGASTRVSVKQWAWLRRIEEALL